MADGRRIAVLASGRGTDLQSLIDAHAEGRIASRVGLVLSDRPDAKAIERAGRHGIVAAVLEPKADMEGPARRRDHDARLMERLETEGVDLVVLAGYMRLLGPDLVKRFRHRIVNIHPALLPSFPGLHAQAQALEWGTRLAGCTTHFVDEEVDHGPIILQAAVPLRPDDTEETLSRRILAVEHQILPRTVHLWEQDLLRVEGRSVRIRPDESWTKKYPTIPDVLYGPGY